MMFPLQDDVILDYERPPSRGACKCFCRFIYIFVILAAIVLIGYIYNNLSDETNDIPVNNVENGDYPHTCKVEIGEKTKEELKLWIQKEVETSTKLCSKSNRINPEQMRNIVREELKKQQKNQLKPDFASASAGGMILSASPTWTEGYSYIYFMFIPLRSTAPSPSIILEPTRQAGECWPMEGQEGSVIIRLAARANIVGFTMEHIDPAMSLSGGIPEAPNNFSVYGIENPDDSPSKDKHFFGNYCYDSKKDEESQYFRVQNINRKSFLYIELEILSNHGNEKYTCIYRFQVHGFIDRAYHCN